MTCAKLAGMLEQGPAAAVIHPLECVSTRGRAHPVERGGPRMRGPGTRMHACIAVLAALLLALGPGCSLLLDFDLPDRDAAVIIDAAAPDAPPLDAGPDAALDAMPGMQDGGPADGGDVDATPALLLDDR